MKSFSKQPCSEYPQYTKKNSLATNHAPMSTTQHDFGKIGEKNSSSQIHNNIPFISYRQWEIRIMKN